MEVSLHGWWGRVSAVLTVCLGLFWIVSGVGKLLNVGAFVEVVRAYGVPYRLSYGAALIPPVEVLLGVAMMALFRTRLLASVSLGLLFAFTAAFAYGHFVLGLEDCGCFGEIGMLATPPLISFLRNALLIAASFMVWRHPVSLEVMRRRWLLPLLSVIGAVAFTAAGMSVFQPFSSPDAVERALLNRPVQNTPLAGLLNASPDSTYLVYVFSTTCPHCWNSMENVKAFQRTGAVDRVVGVTASADTAVATFTTRFEPNFPIKVVRRDVVKSLVTGVPTAFFVRGGTVTHVVSGMLSSPYTFERYAQGRGL